MKRLTMIFGIMMLAPLFAIPAYAMGGGMGGGTRGDGMTSSWGSGLLDWFQKWRNGGDYTLPPVEEKNQMEELDQQHDEDSAYLKYQIKMKEKQLDALLGSSDPDIQKARTLSKGIRELRDEADQEQRRYEVEAGKMNPGYRSGTGNGWSAYTPPVGNGSRRMGYGGRTRDYGLDK
jgi:hypothetical protein